MRGRAWQHLCGAHELLLKNKGVFDVSDRVLPEPVQYIDSHYYILQDLVQQPDTEIVVNVIDKDLDRTFPAHTHFAKPGSQG